MSQTKSATIQNHFAGLTDTRRREVTHPLINIVVIAICAVVGGTDDFVAIAKFGRTKRDWLARFLDLKNGIPSHDRFNAVLAAIKPAEFEKCLLGWITSTMTSLARRCGGIRPAKRGTVARSIVTTISVRCRTTCRIVLAGRICVRSGS